MKIDIFQEVIFVILLWTLIVDKISTIPSMNTKFDVICKEINKWIEYENDHGCHNLHANIFVPLCSKISIFSDKVFIQECFALVFNKISSYEKWKENGVYKQTYEKSKRHQHGFSRPQVEADDGKNRSCDQREQKVVNDDCDGCDPKVVSAELFVDQEGSADLT